MNGISCVFSRVLPSGGRSQHFRRDEQGRAAADSSAAPGVGEHAQRTDLGEMFATKTPYLATLTKPVPQSLPEGQ